MSCRARSWFKVRIRRGLDPKLRIVQIWYAVIWDDSIYFWLFGYRIFLMNHVMISFHLKWFFNVEMQEKPFKNSEMVLSIKLSSWQARKRKVREKECHLHFPLGFFAIYILLAKPMSFLMLVHFFCTKNFQEDWIKEVSVKLLHCSGVNMALKYSGFTQSKIIFKKTKQKMNNQSAGKDRKITFKIRRNSLIWGWRK